MSVDLMQPQDSKAGSPSPMRQLSPNPLRSSVIAGPGGVSQHAAALADAMYAATAQALSLLCSLAPEVRCPDACAVSAFPNPLWTSQSTAVLRLGTLDLPCHVIARCGQRHWLACSIQHGYSH